jgi:hypothetical protein
MVVILIVEKMNSISPYTREGKRLMKTAPVSYGIVSWATCDQWSYLTNTVVQTDVLMCSH